MNFSRLLLDDDDTDTTPKTYVTHDAVCTSSGNDTYSPRGFCTRRGLTSFYLVRDGGYRKGDMEAPQPCIRASRNRRWKCKRERNWFLDTLIRKRRFDTEYAIGELERACQLARPKIPRVDIFLRVMRLPSVSSSRNFFPSLANSCTWVGGFLQSSST